ncbi:MFS transporter [Aldersonia kunmingensis]|uniref:MFS transporter n=1 Tax=Aldersonia kunmingensis TaxID=408066 RepID=UPI000834E022|nr:MFS transporter [Aldersonia kunmingensis]
MTTAERAIERDAPAQRTSRTFAAVLAVLFTVGWMANHFVSVIPVLREHEQLSDAVLDAVFGVYAIGLLPGLLGGGALSDKVGRARVVLPGAAITIAGSLLLLAWHDGLGLAVGRLVVGIGAGLAMGAGTAWAADIGGARGTTVAGVVLTAGFGCGPLASGLLGEFVPAPIVVTFAVAAGLGLAALIAAIVWTGSAPRRTRPVAADHPASAGQALSWALPLAPFVFASVTIAFVSLPARLPDSYSGPLVPGLAATLGLGSGIAVQVLARRKAFGPLAGSVGAGLAALGYVLAALCGAEPPVWALLPCCVVLGSAYGLCLRTGLLDIEQLTPPSHRGALTGVFYVGTYLGFAVPLTLVALESSLGDRLPLFVLAVLAAVVAVQRTMRIRRGAYPV